MGEPKIEEQAEQPYVAVSASVRQPEIPQVVPAMFGEIFGWVGSHDVAQTGPAFIRYRGTDASGVMEIEVGCPVAAPHAGDERVKADSFPAGRYATVVYVGPYDRLCDVHCALGEWIGKNNLRLVETKHADGSEVWGARTEFYISDPAEEPDPQKWETWVSFLIES